MSPFATTGFLFPEGFLDSAGFRVFAVFVGINTLVYLGLTAGRLVPWPKPVAAHRLQPLRTSHDPEEVDVTDHAPALRQLTDPARRLRLEAAFQTIPIALTLSGALAMVATIVLVFTSPQVAVVSDIAGALFALAVLILAQFAGRRAFPPAVLPWLWSVGMAGVVSFITWQAAEEGRGEILAYSLIILVALIPISLSWPAGVIGGALAFIAVNISGFLIDSAESTTWGMAALISLAVGGILLQLRIISLDRIAAEQARIATLLTSDPLTGALSRRGLTDLAPSAWRSAEASDLPVYAVVLTVDDLLEINQSYGIGFGDDVLTATYRSLRQALPDGALVARWTAGAFAAVGTGVVSPDDVVVGVRQAIGDSGVMLGKRAARLSVRVHTGRPNAVSAEELIAEATAAEPVRT